VSLNPQLYILPEKLEALVKESLADGKQTFGLAKAAQARGDFAVLAERGRRAVRLHIGKNVKGDLAKLTKATKKAQAMQSF
jgi:hypothetical protein